MWSCISLQFWFAFISGVLIFKSLKRRILVLVQYGSKAPRVGAESMSRSFSEPQLSGMWARDFYFSLEMSQSTRFYSSWGGGENSEPGNKKIWVSSPSCHCVVLGWSLGFSEFVFSSVKWSHSVLRMVLNNMMMWKHLAQFGTCQALNKYDPTTDIFIIVPWLPLGSICPVDK